MKKEDKYPAVSENYSFLDTQSTATVSFVREFRKKYSFDMIVGEIERLKNMKVLIIGDGIIDEYYYCESMGKSPKSQLIVHKYLNKDVFCGGVFAIANNVAEICGNVTLVSLLGTVDSQEGLIVGNLNPLVHPRFFFRDDGPTIIKRRYINNYNKQKMFEINYINDEYIDGGTEAEIINHIDAIIDGYDLVIVSDFGHGFITPGIIRFIEQRSKKLAVNSQTNGANAGYNLITKYKKTFLICIDAPEARLATQQKFLPIDEVGKLLMSTVASEYLMITIGGGGSVCFSGDGTINHTPALSIKVVDIIGAGDALFSYTAPCFAAGLPVDMSSFIGNAVGALAVQIVGNKKPVEKQAIINLIGELYERRSA